MYIYISHSILMYSKLVEKKKKNSKCMIYWLEVEWFRTVLVEQHAVDISLDLYYKQR